MDVNQSVAFFLNIIENSSYWKKFKGSEVTRYIGEFAGKLSNRNVNVAERSLQESFLSLAIRKSSILAHAESRGYVALKRIPHRLEVTITNSTSQSFIVPDKTPLFSSDNNLPYLLVSAVTIAPGQSQKAVVIQASVSTLSTGLKQSGKFISQVLGRAISQQIAEFDVYVTEPDSPRALWTKTNKFRNTHSNTRAYVEFYNAQEQIGIRFGNDISGKIPELGSVVTIECLLTEGVSNISAGQSLEFVNNDGFNEALTVTTGETLVVGAEREDIESIRINALYYPTYDNNVVLDGDYRFFINTNMRTLTWLSVWGEGEQEKLKGGQARAFINKIYISAYEPSTNQAELMTAIDRLCKNNLSTLNKKYIPVQAKTAPFTVDVKGKILSTQDPVEVEKQIRSELLSSYSHSIKKHGGDISYDDIYGTIRDMKILKRFKVTVSADLDTSVPIDTYRYLDVANSTFNLSS